MNKILTVITVTAIVSGCSSMQHASTMTPADQHQAAKTQYYEDLNQHQYHDRIHAIAEVDTKLERVSAGAANGIGQ